jgi:hypothetical protein
MENYFLSTLVYFICIYVLKYITLRDSFIVAKHQYQFLEAVCRREQQLFRYSNNQFILELVYMPESRKFNCRLTDAVIGVQKPWKIRHQTGLVSFISSLI